MGANIVYALAVLCYALALVRIGETISWSPRVLAIHLELTPVGSLIEWGFMLLPGALLHAVALKLYRRTYGPDLVAEPIVAGARASTLGWLQRVVARNRSLVIGIGVVVSAIGVLGSLSYFSAHERCVRAHIEAEYLKYADSADAEAGRHIRMILEADARKQCAN